MSNIIPSSGGGSDITLPVSIVDGGTGADNSADALVNLGAAESGDNTDLASVSLTKSSTISVIADTVPLTIFSAPVPGFANTAEILELRRGLDNFLILSVNPVDGGVTSSGDLRCSVSRPNVLILNPGTGGFYFPSGANTPSGNGTIGGGGSVDVINSLITAGSIIIVSNTSPVPTPIGEDIASRVVGTMTVNGTPGNTFSYIIINTY